SNLHNPQCNIYCWVDQTKSMEYLQNQVSTGQMAFNLIDSLNRYLSVSSRLFLYNSESKKFDSKRDNIGQFKSSFKPLNMNKFFETALTDTKLSSEKSVLVLFSDFQEPVSDKVDSLLENLPERLSVICVSLTPPSPRNYSLKYVFLSGEQNIGGVVCADGAWLDNGKLFSEIGNVRTETVLLDVKENECANVQLSILGRGNLHGGKVVLDVDDPLQFDNVSFFSPHKQHVYRVLVIGDKQKNSVIASALNVLNKKWNPVILKDEQEVVYSDMDSSDVIIINSVMWVSKQIDAFIAGYSGKEKTFVFAIENSGKNAQMHEVGTVALLKKAFNDIPVGKSIELQKSLPLVLPDTISDLWRGFPEMRSSEVAVNNYYDNIPGEALLHFGNGRSFMSHVKDKASRNWIVLSTSIGITEDNNLCETGFFVPFIDRICTYGAAQMLSNESVLIAGVSYKNPFFNTNTSASVYDSESRLVITLQGQSMMVFDLPGVYKVVPDGRTPYYLTVAADPAESVISYRQPKKHKNSLNMSSSEFLMALNSRQSVFFWYLPWIILFCLIVLETLLWENKKAE
ncbi:MAG: hypothetical protein Q4F84_04485, partial [Fibrobacter sp.]|nr:hypothetical protein [Fibrobacter sp.]